MVLVAVVAGPAQAAPPPNDAPTGAEVVPAAGPFPFLSSTVDITDAADGGEASGPSCTGGIVDQTVWSSFTPWQPGRHVLSLGGTSTTGLSSSFLGIYTSTGGSAGPFTEVPTSGAVDGCDKGFNESDLAEIQTNLTPGTTY